MLFTLPITVENIFAVGDLDYDVEADVIFECYPPEKRTWEYPGSPAQITQIDYTITKVSVFNGLDFALSELDKETQSSLQKEFEKYLDSNDLDLQNDVADALAEEAADNNSTRWEND